MNVEFYEAHGLMQIPLNHDIAHEHPDGVVPHSCDTCRFIKRPCVKWRDYKGFSAEQWFNKRASYRREDHSHSYPAPAHKHPPFHPPGRGGLTGRRAGRVDGYYPFVLDHDHLRPSIRENIRFYRRLGTWVNFTPSNQYHAVYMAPRKYSMSELVKGRIACSPDKHDIIWWIPASERKPREKMGQGYFCHEPTTLSFNGRARPYFWLDESRMVSGELEIKRLDL